MDQLKLLLSLLVILKAERGLEFIPLSCICSGEHFPSSRHSRSHVSFQRGSDPFYFFVFLTTITKRRGILNSFSDGSSPHPLQLFSASFGETFPDRFSSEIFCRDLTSDSKSESKEDSSSSELIQSVRRSSRIEFSGRIWPTNINWKKILKLLPGTSDGTSCCRQVVFLSYFGFSQEILSCLSKSTENSANFLIAFNFSQN